MQSLYEALGALVADADIRLEAPVARTAIDHGVRASLLCTLFGIDRERWVWPYSAAAAMTPPARLLAEAMAPFGHVAELGTLAGASDLDPMDPGPSHTVLAATLAACVVQDAIGHEADDEALRSAVLGGIEAAWRIRSSLVGTRPGLGFHSPGVFGTLAAAGATARLLKLDGRACIDALAIGLTRASGLAINSAASTIGLTHFGWGAFHGVEAGLLASQGWGASHDFGRGLATLFGEEHVNLAALTGNEGSRAAASLVFKRYPCNIYLNLVATLLETASARAPDRIEITLPWVPHLDCPQPADLRQARNSAQAVAAIAGSGDLSYAAFSGRQGPWLPPPATARLLGNVTVRMDRNAPTGLRHASVGVRAWQGDALVHEATGAMRDLGPWGIDHARRLMGPDDPHGGIDALYGASLMTGFHHVKERWAAKR